MPRRVGCILFLVAIVASIVLFSYNIYISMHSSLAKGNLGNTACAANCTPTAIKPTSEPTLAVTPTATSFSSLPGGYRLAWNDEFDGGRLDTTKWFAVNSQGGPGQRGCCLNYSYSSLTLPSQLQVHDGMLTIRTERNNGGGYAYKTGAITTETQSDQPTFTFTYGRVDIRAKLPTGTGVWPAMWLLTAPATTTVSYEIDIMEMLGQDPHTLYQVVHHDGGREYCQDKGPDYSQGFHTYTFDWEPGKLSWAIDGQTLCNVTHYVPSQPMYLVINTALSDGSWGRSVNGSTPLPQNFDIDYVRVYQRHT